MNTYELTGHIPLQNKTTGIVSWRGLLEFEKSLFVIVNMMDVVMTSLLLNTGSFVECNPIAAFVISKWGFTGMTMLKLLVIALVLLISNVIAIWRIRTSRYLLNFGSLLVGTVVVYSVFLFGRFYGWF